MMHPCESFRSAAPHAYFGAPEVYRAHRLKSAPNITTGKVFTL